MNTRRLSGALALAAILGGPGACRDPDPLPPLPTPSVRDSAGARIVTSPAPRWGPGEGWTVSAEPVLRIGSIDGTSPSLFDGIAGVTRLSDGTIVVLDTGSAQLRYFSASGEHVRSVGREGRGPGEMRAPRWLQKLPDGSVQVTHTDGRLRFGPDGSLVADDRMRWDRVHEIAPAAPRGSAGFLMESCPVDTPLFLGEAVLLCASSWGDVRFLPDEPGVYRVVSLVVRADWSLGTLDTLALFDRGRLIMYRASGRVHPTRLSPPYGPDGQMGVSGSPPWLTYAHRLWYRVERHAIDGPEGPLVMERAGGLRAPTTAERRGFERAFRPESPFDTGRFRVPPGDPAAFRDQVEPADSVSVISGAPRVDALGTTWVPLEPGPSDSRRIHDVFDEEGVYLGQVALPHLRVHEIGPDYVLGVETDELGVEYVVLYALDRGGP